MNSATMAAVIAANIAAQNAARSATSTNSSVALSSYPLPVIIATVCLCALACIVGVGYVQFTTEHPAISAIIMIIAIVLCIVWYGTCY